MTVWSRTSGLVWARTTVLGLDGIIAIPAAGIDVPLAEIYAGVTFPARPGPDRSRHDLPFAEPPRRVTARPTYYEFFAGGGMARAGLGAGWQCVFANDVDPMKAATYAANWGGDHLVRADVATLTTADLPGQASLAWASFPCQDLSLAGDAAGLGHARAASATRSGTFWPFWALMKGLLAERRAPHLIVLENVLGVLTSHGGRDFAALGSALSGAGYRFGAVVIDAVRFVPQSRPRVFFIAVAPGASAPPDLIAATPTPDWHARALIAAHAKLSAAAQKRWLWWRLPPPCQPVPSLADLIEDHPAGVAWHTPEQTARLLGMMTAVNRAKVEAVQRSGARMVGCVYRRTRPGADGQRRQRAEVRFDGIAGCLRTPAGGSSRQTVMIVDADVVRSRLLSPREAARLMGLGDGYALPARSNDAYHVAGDGVCPPVVRHIARHLLERMVATPQTISSCHVRPSRSISAIALVGPQLPAG